MAARKLYEDPPAQMLALAGVARRRGLTFDEWWSEAMCPGRRMTLTSHSAADRPFGAVVWPSDGPEAKEWREATIEAREAWRRSYERIDPTRNERALARLAEPLHEALSAASDDVAA